MHATRERLPSGTVLEESGLTQLLRRRLVIAGEEHEVELSSRATASSPALNFDGVTFEIFLGDESTKGRLVILDGRQFRVRCASSRPGSYVMKVDGESIQVSLAAQKLEPIQEDEETTTAVKSSVSTERRNRVTAHMSGKISAVKIRPSDKIEVGTPMFVLVAMKMENTIVAPVSGIVRAVRVTQGASVNRGDVLAIIE